MKIYEDIVYFMYQISIVGIHNWSFERVDVKWSATHRKGSQNITFGANIKTSSPKNSQISQKSCAKNFIPIGSRSVIHLIMSGGLKLFPVVYPTHYTFTYYYTKYDI